MHPYYYNIQKQIEENQKKKKDQDFLAYCCGLFVVIMIILLVIVTKASAESGHNYAVDTTKAVIHHTASPDWSVDRIRKIHIEERGWDDVGYHFIIRKDGTIEKGRSLYKRGAHAKGERNGWIGIAFTGNSEFTTLQANALQTLVNYYGISHIERHHEQCPGIEIVIKRK